MLTGRPEQRRPQQGYRYRTSAGGRPHLKLEQISTQSPFVLDPCPATFHQYILQKTEMHAIGKAFLQTWHRTLHLSKQTPPLWYRDRLREELRERRSARTTWERLSETSDVLFSISRAKYDGFPICKLPWQFSVPSVLVYTYMLAKFSSRWMFYKTLALLCGAHHYRTVCEVINPHKDGKLVEVAVRHQIDPVQFTTIGRKLRRFWPLLP